MASDVNISGDRDRNSGAHFFLSTKKCLWSLYLMSSQTLSKKNIITVQKETIITIPTLQSNPIYSSSLRGCFIVCCIFGVFSLSFIHSFMHVFNIYLLVPTKWSYLVLTPERDRSSNLQPTHSQYSSTFR